MPAVTRGRKRDPETTQKPATEKKSTAGSADSTGTRKRNSKTSKPRDGEKKRRLKKDTAVKPEQTDGVADDKCDAAVKDDVSSIITSSWGVTRQPLAELNFSGTTKRYSVGVIAPPAQRSHNLMHFLHQKSLGQRCRKTLKEGLSEAIVSNVTDLTLLRNGSPFDRRVTAMAWHPTKSHTLVAGSKGGDIILWNTDSVNQEKFLYGIGPGGSVQAMKFWPEDTRYLLTASIDGKVSLVDLEAPGENADPVKEIFLSTGSWEHWYCSVDVSAKRRMIVAGHSSTGTATGLSLNGEKLWQHKLHKAGAKLTHVEFSPREDWLLCTASTDRTVKLWDTRMMSEKTPLVILPHNKPPNSAYFSLTDGCRLLTTDQGSELRVYNAPCWGLETTIEHPHRFFQHITPIKANWHPLHDLIVVGRYPDPKLPSYQDKEPRSLEMFSADTGKLVGQKTSPVAKGIQSLVLFDPSGDYLATSMGFNLLIWSLNPDEKQKQEQRLAAIFDASDPGLDGHNYSRRGNGTRPPPPRPLNEKPAKKKTLKKEESEKTKIKQKLKKML